MTGAKCNHITQYAEPGRPLPCADWECPGSPPGKGYEAPRQRATGRRWLIEVALFTRIHDVGMIVWRQETPWT